MSDEESSWLDNGGPWRVMKETDIIRVLPLPVLPGLVLPHWGVTCRAALTQALTSRTSKTESKIIWDQPCQEGSMARREWSSAMGRGATVECRLGLFLDRLGAHGLQ